MNDFESIDLQILDSVTGGETSSTNVNVGATIPTPRGPAQIGVQGGNTATNYKVCADTVKSMGGTPADLRSTCGLPPGGNP